MKAISLWQPYATLIAIGAKSIETRGWGTRYRGPLLIHAAKKKDRDALALQSIPGVFRTALARGGIFGPHDLPLGAIVAEAYLLECVRVMPYSVTRRAVWRVGTRSRDWRVPPAEPELSFGDYTPGRWAWLLVDVEPLRKPIPWRGKQGFFEVPDEVIAA